MGIPYRIVCARVWPSPARSPPPTTLPPRQRQSAIAPSASHRSHVTSQSAVEQLVPLVVLVISSCSLLYSSRLSLVKVSFNNSYSLWITSCYGNISLFTPGECSSCSCVTVTVVQFVSVIHLEPWLDGFCSLLTSPLCSLVEGLVVCCTFLSRVLYTVLYNLFYYKFYRLKLLSFYFPFSPVSCTRMLWPHQSYDTEV